MEVISLFFAAIVWWEIAILAVVGLAVVALLWEEHGSLPFLGFLFLMFYPWGTYGAFIEITSIFDLWVFIVVYIGIGLLWSFFKWGRLIKQYIKESETDESVRWKLKTFSNDTIAYWILWWPFSALGFVFDDAIQWIIEHFKGVYNIITEKMLSQALKTEELKTEEVYEAELETKSDMNSYFKKKKRNNR